MKCFISKNSLDFSIPILLSFICGCSTMALLSKVKIEPSIKATQVAEHAYKLTVNDIVNMLVFNGPGGALLVDTGCEYVDLIHAELKKIGVENIKFIINTHSHDDHVEGNVQLGRGAVIISSQRCRDILLEDDDFPESGLPNLTFTDSMSLYFNDEIINLKFLPGHSDNDIIVHFVKANIACIGDFGFSHTASTWPGYSANVYDMARSLIWMANHFHDGVKIIHGHEHNYTLADLKLDAKMVADTIQLVTPLIQQGLNLDQIKERNPLKNSPFSIIRENSEKWLWNLMRDKK